MSNDQAWFIVMELVELYAGGNVPGATKRLCVMDPERTLEAMTVITNRFVELVKQNTEFAARIATLEKRSWK